MAAAIIEREVPRPGGRVLRAYDTGPDGGSGLTVIWHHGSPQTGRLPEPLLGAAAVRGIRLLAYAELRRVHPAAGPHGRGCRRRHGRGPGCRRGAAGGGDGRLRWRLARPGRGGAAPGPHRRRGLPVRPRALHRRVRLVRRDGQPGRTPAGAQGRVARAAYAEVAEFDENSFTAADYAALKTSWVWLGADAGRGGQESPDGLIDDDVALVQPWGIDLGDLTNPVLLVHGREDRVIPFAHSAWLTDQLPGAELWVRPRDGHISVLEAVPVALDWLQEHTDR